jgi:hypothetical protein
MSMSGTVVETTQHDSLSVGLSRKESSMGGRLSRTAVLEQRGWIERSGRLISPTHFLQLGARRTQRKHRMDGRRQEIAYRVRRALRVNRQGDGNRRRQPREDGQAMRDRSGKDSSGLGSTERGFLGARRTALTRGQRGRGLRLLRRQFPRRVRVITGSPDQPGGPSSQRGNRPQK